jgi:hypothetical protein
MYLMSFLILGHVDGKVEVYTYLWGVPNLPPPVSTYQIQ